MKETGVLITGLGVVSATGRDLAESLYALGAGRRSGGKVTLFETSLEYPVFEVKGIAEEFFLPNQRTFSLALCALDEALGDAGLNHDVSGLRVGVCMGTTVASQLNDLEFYRTFRGTGSAPMDAVDRYLKGNLAEFIRGRVRASGPALTVANACSSGADAVGVALSWVRGGLCDVALAGGADELSLVPLCGFGSLGIVSNELCAPFDRDRKGLNLGEGAGVLVIETEESARKRGKLSNLYIAGYGSAGDAYHLTAPHPEGVGLESALRRALEESGAEPSEIGFVNAHGTATPDNDRVEGRTLKRVLGTGVKILSTKGFTGHTLGAAGAIEAVFTAAALREGWMPCNAGFKTHDEDIGLSPVAEKTAVTGRYALSTSLAFGGNNAALVLRAGD